MIRTVGANALRSYRQSGVVTRLAASSCVILLLVLATALVSLSMGPVNISVDRVASIVLSYAGLDLAPFGRTEQLIIEQIRLPRIVVGALVGMALGVAGATMQGPVPQPHGRPRDNRGIGGRSGGSGSGHRHRNDRPVLSRLARVRLRGCHGGPRFSSTVSPRLVADSPWLRCFWLAWRFNAFLGAIVSAIIILLPDNGALREILFWLAGGLDSRSWEHVRIAAPLILVGTAVIMVMTRDLNLLTLGDDEARSMGIRVDAARVLLLAAAALVTGAAVAVSGTIAFVGLVTPHILRLVLGPDHRVLVPMSALGGAAFVILADTVARVVIQPAELRVSIITAFVGAPFFIFLLIKNKRQVYSL